MSCSVNRRVRRRSRARPLDEGNGLARLPGRHAGGGLVQEQDLRLQRQRDAQLELLLAAMGEESRLLARPVEEAHRAEDRVRLVGVEALHPLEEAPAASPVGDVGGLHVLEHGEAREDIGALEGAPMPRRQRSCGAIPVMSCP
jgi:hypothetical protein